MPGFTSCRRACRAVYRGRYSGSRGRGPTRCISPRSTLISCGSSSMLVFRRNLPNGVMRSSSGARRPSSPRNSNMVRNFRNSNSAEALPIRLWRNRTGAPRPTKVAQATAASKGPQTGRPRKTAQYPAISLDLSFTVACRCLPAALLPVRAAHVVSLDALPNHANEARLHQSLIVEFHGASAASGSHLVPQLPALQKLKNTLGQLDRVAGRTDEAVNAADNGLSAPPDISCYDGQTAGHSLNYAARESFPIRWQHENVGRSQKRRHFVHLPRESKALRHSLLRHQGYEARAKLIAIRSEGRPNHQEVTSLVLLADFHGHLQELSIPLLLDNPAYHANDGRGLGNAQPGSNLLEFGPIFRPGIKRMEPDAVPDRHGLGA